MKIKRNTELSLPDTFYQLIEKEIIEASKPDEGAKRITLNFLDPGYCAQTGGYHPVNVGLVKDMKEWRLISISDYAYQGLSNDLVKEIDICFTTNKAYSMFTEWLDSGDSQELLSMLLNNFVEYYDMGVYRTAVYID
ncbi:DUF2787 family protein [Thalassotalea aquiviva]|uniref:DUF2787 family protein n=1 Tax=Thalassotalea aquiviva TaxID=3242415 RepID=UPI00352A2B2C